MGGTQGGALTNNYYRGTNQEEIKKVTKMSKAAGTFNSGKKLSQERAVSQPTKICSSAKFRNPCEIAKGYCISLLCFRFCLFLL